MTSRPDAAAVFDRAFWSGNPLDELYNQVGPTPTSSSEKVFASGMLEWRRSHREDGGLIAGALVGLFVSHRRGIYYALMTIAFGQVFWFSAIKPSSSAGVHSKASRMA